MLTWRKFFEVLAFVVVFAVPVILYLMEKAGASLTWIFIVGWLSIAVAALYLVLSIPWVWADVPMAVRVWRISLMSAIALLAVGYGATKIWPGPSKQILESPEPHDAAREKSADVPNRSPDNPIKKLPEHAPNDVKNQPSETHSRKPPHTPTQRKTALGAFDNWLAGIENPPSMSDVFQNDFSNTMKLTDDAIGIEWKDNGTTTRIKRQLYLDFPAYSKFVGFYIPTSDPLDPSRTFEACLRLVQSDAVQQALDEMPKRTPIVAGLGQTTTIGDLTFSGRVVIYHDDLLSITQQSDIIRAFAAKHYAVGFFGPNDFGKTLSSWHRLHDAKTVNQ